MEQQLKFNHRLKLHQLLLTGVVKITGKKIHFCKQTDLKELEEFQIELKEDLGEW